jgi:hypothetical protein
MTSSLAQSDYRVLRDLANGWGQDRRSTSFAAGLHAALDEIGARRTEGPDFFDATVRGDSISEMRSAALLKAAEFYGPDAQLEITGTGTVSGTGSSRPIARVYVHCLNYAEISS